MKKRKLRCPYCGSYAVLKDASFVYGNNSRGGKVYACSHYPACDAYVGVHVGTTIPKGTLANKALREKRILAHRIFDQIWKQNILTKSEAYHWIADKFGLDCTHAHIGKFSEYMCDQLICESKRVLLNNRISLQTAS